MKDIWIYGENDEWVIRIGVNLHLDNKDQLIYLMKQYKEIFSWSTTDMPRVDIIVACLKLSINLSVKLI